MGKEQQKKKQELRSQRRSIREAKQEAQTRRENLEAQAASAAPILILKDCGLATPQDARPGSRAFSSAP